MSRPSIDITGELFCRLTAIENIGANKFGHAYWKCKCACGNDHSATANNLKMGLVRSCGCLRRSPKKF